MTSLELIEVDPTPGGCGLPNSRTVKAVSSSYQTLVDYCKETFDSPIGEKKDMWAVYYEIKNSNIVIVQENINKFD